MLLLMFHKIGIAEVNCFFYVNEGRYTCNLCTVQIYELHIMFASEFKSKPKEDTMKGKKRKYHRIKSKLSMYQSRKKNDKYVNALMSTNPV